MKFHSYALILAISIVGLSSMGCATWKKPSTEKSSWNPANWFKKEYQEPVSMATIWRSDKMAEPGQREMRGFGARVYFYNDKSQAIPVEGDLIVHGYITTPSSRKEPKEEPDRKFTYSSEQLASQYSPSDLGASYSVWVPWDEGGFREEVTLIATFKSKKGSVVQGSPTKINLPGKSPLPEEQINEQKKPLTQQVSYSKSSMSTYEIAPSPEKIPSTRITTIELPSNSRLTRPNAGVAVSAAAADGNINTNFALDGTGVEVGGGRSKAVPTIPDAFRFETLPPPGANVSPSATSTQGSAGASILGRPGAQSTSPIFGSPR